MRQLNLHGVKLLLGILAVGVLSGLATVDAVAGAGALPSHASSAGHEPPFGPLPGGTEVTDLGLVHSCIPSSPVKDPTPVRESAGIYWVRQGDARPWVTAPPELATSWCFISRLARHPRAPSVS